MGWQQGWLPGKGEHNAAKADRKRVVGIGGRGSTGGNRGNGGGGRPQAVASGETGILCPAGDSGSVDR